MMVILMALQWLDNIMANPFHPATFPQAIRSSFVFNQREVALTLDLNWNIIHPVRQSFFCCTIVRLLAVRYSNSLSFSCTVIKPNLRKKVLFFLQTDKKRWKSKKLYNIVFLISNYLLRRILSKGNLFLKKVLTNQQKHQTKRKV